MEWILGTVQLGAPYGINNRTGMPDSEEAMRILERAFELGVRILDTAAAYGSSQDRIAEYQRANPARRFKVISKIKRDDFISGGLDAFLRKTVRHLETENLEALLFHRFEDSTDPEMLAVLTAAKDAGWIRKIGVSVYGNDELALAAANPAIDLIQLPYNLLDSWALRGPGILAARDAGKSIHVRSVLLQGLFHARREDLPERLLPLGPALTALRGIAEREVLDLGTLAIRYAKHRAEVDGVLIGVETRTQLEGSLGSGAGGISSEAVREIESIRDVPLHLLDPRNWK